MESLIQELKSIRNVDRILEKSYELSGGLPIEKALSYYLKRWIEGANNLGFDPLNIDMFMSADRSAAMLGPCPVVFLGTNDWATKRWQSVKNLEDKASIFSRRAHAMTAGRSKNVVFLVVPEKDIVIDKIRGEESTKLIDGAMSFLKESLKEIPCVYDEFLPNLPYWRSTSEYTYPDSHLLSRDYAMIFSEIVKKFNLPEVDWSRYDFRCERQYGDLNNKFGNRLAEFHCTSVPSLRGMNEQYITITGSLNFESPLSETKQTITNSVAPIDASIHIYGDSHCSIYKARKLTYLFSTIFRSVIFEWNPWGVRGGNVEMTADYVLMEISQRFIL